MLDNQEFTDDYEVNKKLYEIYKHRFTASAVRNDTNDIKTYRTLRIPLTTQENTFKGKGRYLREVAPKSKQYQEYQIKILEEPYPKKCRNNGKMVR